MLVIKNGKIVTMANRLIDGGDILINENKICEIRDKADYVPTTSDIVIEARDSFVFPGFIDIYTHCGLDCTNTGIGDIYNRDIQLFPQNKTCKYIDTTDPGFNERLKKGITSIGVAPFDYHLVGGKSCIVKTAGHDNRLNIVTEYGYEKLSFNIENTEIAAPLLSECFTSAINYISSSKQQARKNYPLLNEYKPILYDNKPCFISVADTKQLKTAMQFVQQYSLNGTIILSGNFADYEEAVSDFNEELSYVFTPLNSSPGFRRYFARELSNNVKAVALSTSETLSCIDMLTVNAGIMVHDGLDMEKTIAAITTTPASLCKLENRIGSLQVGLDADIVICDISPLDMQSNVLYTIIDGKICYNN